MNHQEFHEATMCEDENAVKRDELPCGDYTLLLGNSTDSSKIEGHRIMHANGCKRVRFEELADGRMVVHGYVSA